MATTGRPDEPATPASDVAASCRDAGLVGLVGAPRGDALAAVGLLGRALAAADVPFQARIPPLDAPGDLGATDADCTIALCRADLAADHAVGPTGAESVADRAYEIATELGDGDPVLGLAAALAGGADPGGAVHEDARAAGIERRPGVAVPTTDLADGLAHATLVHAPFSGDRAAAADALADLDLPVDSDSPDGSDGPVDSDRSDDAETSAGDVDAEALDADDHRRIASLVALAVAETEACPPQATRAVERVLHPYAGGPLETVGGYADVLDALARTDPGLGIAVALGRADATAGLATWRDHCRRVHGVVEAADRERHDGLVVVRADGDSISGATSGAEAVSIEAPTLEPVARLVRDYRSPEPTVLCRAPGAVVLTTVADDVDAAAVLHEAVAEASVADSTNDVANSADTANVTDAANATDAAVRGDDGLATAPAVDDRDAVVEAVRRAVR